ncbi:DUF1801 domain-containing protein [Leptospira gomenensis]|uniref:DUF1801 domain-containing protein n=1 Tax=Leptospira gomenensis TaxID=2484974 RepID=A0A5F1YAE9_9LEPT|nr:DUF1801 domain-containing protein [Leptospira gomenensis]TGK32382.1 DUF1801 domain-containing protein [Leptospira gomenensis]TGK43974.1 DUF1801 domain-containing protein [Leptospira gomenensis]TGK48949.1 DUF1801 domain-containing protein [Leptospira gomenensis]TGK54660.1 DUF1801 domain-containing protein [Leptospira gomenensis]
MNSKTSKHNKTNRRFQKAEVAEIFRAYPEAVRDKLLRLRELIFETADSTEGVGSLEEAIKWGQPSYLTPETKSGSTIRIDRLKNDENRYAIFFHCQTDLIANFRELFSGKLEFEGNRCILLKTDRPAPEKELKVCISMALTYHRDKKKG